MRADALKALKDRSLTVITQNLEARAGERLGEHQLHELIAIGGFGAVYRAESPEGEIVAIKILREELVTSEEAVGRFAQEAVAISRIDHPGVVKLYEVSRTSEGQPYMVTEFLSGADLMALLERDGPMPLRQVAKIVAELAEAIDVVHRAGFVHRDIKPSNIMLTKGETERVVLLDFGIAKLANAEGPGLTESQFTVGTPASMAPEQIRGEQVDGRTDVYALGALVFSLLTAKLPYSESPPMLLTSQHLFGERPKPSDLVRVPALVDAIVAKAMALEPNDRYHTAVELAKELQGTVDGFIADEVVDKATIKISITVILPDGAATDERALDDSDQIIDLASGLLDDFGFECLRDAGNALVYQADTTEVTEARLKAILRLLDQALASREAKAPGVRYVIGSFTSATQPPIDPVI